MRFTDRLGFPRAMIRGYVLFADIIGRRVLSACVDGMRVGLVVFCRFA